MMTVAPTPHVRRAGFVATITSLGVIAFATLLPEPGFPALGSHLCLVCGSFGGVNALLNILLFVPLGIGLALSGAPGSRAVVGMCALSAMIESAQFFVIAGRYSAVGDVFANGLGGALGFAICRHTSILLRPSRRVAFALTVLWSAVWLAIQTISAVGFSPSIPSSDFYGQIAPRFGHSEQFHGRVLRANIAEVEVRDAQFSGSSHVRQLLLRGAVVTTTVVPGVPTHDIAPIVRVVDASQREVMLLAQHGNDLVFGIRTGASALRLRPPFFVLSDVFPLMRSGDGVFTTQPVAVSARYSAREVSMNMRTRTSLDRRIRITASLGWTMLLPFQWFIEGTRPELLLSAIWTACLVFPIGYWVAGVIRFHRVRQATGMVIMAALTTLALLYLGFVVMPKAFGVIGASYADWVAAFTGILMGRALAVRVFAWDTSAVHERA